MRSRYFFMNAEIFVHESGDAFFETSFFQISILQIWPFNHPNAHVFSRFVHNRTKSRSKIMIDSYVNLYRNIFIRTHPYICVSLCVYSHVNIMINQFTWSHGREHISLLYFLTVFGAYHILNWVQNRKKRVHFIETCN